VNGANALVGMSVVCQKGIAAGLAFKIENTMLTVSTGSWRAWVTNTTIVGTIPKNITTDLEMLYNVR